MLFGTHCIAAKTSDEKPKFSAERFSRFFLEGVREEIAK